MKTKIIKNLKEIGISKGKKVLGIFPHPDDETFSSAGFLNQAAASGAQTILVTMTRGEASTLKYGLREGQSLAGKREKELFCAANTLKIFETILGNFPDGKLNKNKSKIKKFLERTISEIKPDFVVILEPNGIYGHPDHIALTKVVMEIYKTKKLRFKLIYATVGEEFRALIGAQALAKKKIIPLKPNIELKLGKKDIEAKINAFKCHKSQFKFDRKFLKKWNARKLIKNEWFYLLG